MSDLIVQTNLCNRYRAGYEKSPVFIRMNSRIRSQEESVELTPYDLEASKIRVTNSTGDELWTFDKIADTREARLEVDICNLAEGTYYVEIQDGFYHQVRMIRIAAA